MKGIAEKIVKRFLVFVIVGMMMLISGVLPVSAQGNAPTDSYTHQFTTSGAKKSVAMRAVYNAEKMLDVRALGITDGIEKIADIDCDEQGNLYLLTTDGRLFAFDTDYRLIKEIFVTENDGKSADIVGAQGILAHSENELYVCDTKNERLIEIDGKGQIKREIVRPESELIPEDFSFAPVKVEKDSKDTLYVLCDGAYYGALLFDRNGEFGGFYGANTVKGSALTAISYVWDTLTKNDTKRSLSVKKLPYQFVDLYIDGKDFVYTCTGQTSKSTSTGQIKKLSPSGTNILYKQNIDGSKTDAGGFNFGETVTEKRNNKEVVQNFVSVQSDEYGYIYSLDATYGIIYVYDTDCNLITAFGGGKGAGNRLGVFDTPVAMVYNGGRVIVADSQQNTVTVFTRTQYGELLFKAQNLTLSADYEGSKEYWEQVLSLDSSSQLAIRGLAKAYFTDGDFEKAKEYAKEGCDYVTYSQALERTQGAFVSGNFVWLFLGGILIVGALIAFVVYVYKHNIVLISNERVRIFLNTVIHPFNSFNLIRYKNMGSLIIAAVMTVLFYISSVINETLSNFRFTSFNANTSSSALQFVKTVGLVALFVIANWAVCVLMEGKGRLKDVFIVTAYATLPLVVYNLVFTVLSHLITSPSSALLAGLSTVAMILTGIVLTVGLMIIHEYSFPKFLGSMVITVFAMLLIIFIIFMLGMLLTQLWSFVITLFMESAYR